MFGEELSVFGNCINSSRFLINDLRNDRSSKSLYGRQNYQTFLVLLKSLNHNLKSCFLDIQSRIETMNLDQMFFLYTTQQSRCSYIVGLQSENSSGLFKDA